MGKGNRERTLRAQDRLDKPQAVVQKKQTPAWVGTAVMILVIAVIVISLLISSLYSSGAMMRSTKALTSDNYTVTGTMMSYFYNSAYSEFVNQYGSIASYIGLDTSASLKSQECGLLDDGSTWYDYFMDMAVSTAEQYLVYCEAAKARGLALDAEDEEEINTALESLASSAASYGYSTKAYITAMYGTGVSEKDIRACMELVLLASKAASDASEEFNNAITADEVAAYYDENSELFLKADYLMTSFSAELESVDSEDYETTDAYNAAAAEADEAYAADKAEALAQAEEYKALSGVQAFLDKLNADLTAKYDGYYDDDDTLTAEEREAKEKSAIAKDLETATVEGYAYADPTAEDAAELDVWMFDEARKVGDTCVIEDEDEEAGTYTVYVYCLTAPQYRDEYTAANISYALFDASESVSASNVLKFMDALTAGGNMTAEAFETLVGGDDYGITAAGEMTNVVKGGFGYDEADEFIFAEGRVAGDCEQVTLGEDYEAVILYVGAGDEAWYASAKSGVLSEKNSAWLEELTTTYTVNVNEKALAKISA